MQEYKITYKQKRMQELANRQKKNKKRRTEQKEEQMKDKTEVRKKKNILKGS